MNQAARRRFVTRRITPVIVVVGGLMAGIPGDAQDSDERQAVQRFGQLCGNETETSDGEPFVEAQFAPVRPLGPSEAPRYGTWQRTYETDDQRYPGNRYVMGSGDDEVDLVSTLRRPMSGDLPPYLWHVISVPSPSDTRVGFVARHEEFTQRERGVWERRQYSELRRSETATEGGETVLFYVELGLPEDIISDITTLWRNTFSDAMEELVLGHYQSPSRAYTHTFIYQDVPQAVTDINRDVGDRRNSSRLVLAPGTAFGFVLNAEGTCLTSTTLTVAAED